VIHIEKLFMNHFNSRAVMYFLDFLVLPELLLITLRNSQMLTLNLVNKSFLALLADENL